MKDIYSHRVKEGFKIQILKYEMIPLSEGFRSFILFTKWIKTYDVDNHIKVDNYIHNGHHLWKHVTVYHPYQCS